MTRTAAEVLEALLDGLVEDQGHAIVDWDWAFPDPADKSVMRLTVDGQSFTVRVETDRA
jgi:hypothetical protein